MTNFNQNDLTDLPKPSKRRGSVIKLTILTLLIVGTTAAILYYLSRDEHGKQELAEQIIENVDKAIKDTPLERVASYMDPPPPQQTTTTTTTPSNTTVSTAPSTEEVVEVEKNNDPPIVSNLTPVVPASTVAPKVEEDNMLSMAFIDDAAMWMVSRYSPSRGLNFSLSAINFRYGHSMRMLMPAGQGDILNARASLLRYAFNAPMLTALYNLYADRFITALGNAAMFPDKGAGLSPRHNILMYEAYADYFKTISAVLDGISATPNFLDYVQKIETLGQESVNIHSQITNSVFELDMARDDKNIEAQEAAQLRIDDLNVSYKAVLAKREQAHNELVNIIQTKSPGAKGVQADTILFIAEWFERRELKKEDTAQVITTVAKLMDDLSGRLNTAANELK